MTKSSTNELFTPFKDPEQEFRSSRRHFKTLSLDELRSPEFNLFSDSEYSKEEVVGTMSETMEQYMSKTRADYGSGAMKEVILFYNGLGIPTRQILDSRGAIPSKTATDAKVAIQEMDGTMEHLASHINKSIPKKEKDPGSFTLPCFISNECFDNALVDLGANINVMPLSTYLNLGLGELAHTKLTVELADRTSKYPKGIAKNVLVGISNFVFPIDFIILDMPEDIKVPLIIGRPFLSTAHAKIDVYKRKITLRVREEMIVFTSVKPASSLIKRVYMLSLRERMELDLEARLMGETLVLNRSLDPFFEDYIELNNLNEPIKLRRNQGNELMPTIEECEVVEEFRAKNDARMDSKVDDYSSYCDHNKKIHINYFAVLEDMDAYRDEGMGDVIFGEPFLSEVGINAKRFDGITTIYNGNDEVTYQMARSHTRYKHHTNEQCNKIPPLLKVSEEDKMNGISHSYQKLKGFYKGVLNLGPEYIRDERWMVTRAE
ncbi:homeodomain-like protein [Tanacetum coccineum]